MQNIFILLFKTILICLLAILIRGTLPRFRFDYLLKLKWKIYFFIYIILIILLTIIKYIFIL